MPQTAEVELISAALDFERLSHCPLCGSAALIVLDEAYNLGRCDSCGYVLDNPRPTMESIIRFYSAKGKYDAWLDLRGPYDRLWRRRLKKLLKHARRGNLLDVGAGVGQFLAIARPHFAAVFGTEVSASGVEAAREQYGVELSHGLVETLDLDLESFDNITLFHVLEHVPDPKALLARCRALLRDEGMLLICVPNDVAAWTSRMKAAGRRLGPKPFRKFSPVMGLPLAGTSREIHLSHFTPPVLRRALTESGFAVQDISLDPYFAAKGVRLALHSAYLALHTCLFRLLGVNGYDTIWAVAFKESRVGN